MPKGAINVPELIANSNKCYFTTSSPQKKALSGTSINPAIWDKKGICGTKLSQF